MGCMVFRGEKVNGKILVVDDDELIRTTLSLFLEKNGFESEVARDAESALALMKRAGYDVVVTDYQMPGMSGLELIGQIRVISPSSAVILISGCMDETLFESCGADLCLRKPFAVDVFMESVSRVLGARSRIRYNRPSSTKLR